MGGAIKTEEREQRIVAVLGFIFLFKFVTTRDLNLLGSTLLGINDMRRTIGYLKRHKLINNFHVSTPTRTSGFYLMDDGLKHIPKSLLQFNYFFYPVRFKPGSFWHNSGVLEVCIWIQKLTTQGYWISEWMIRQGRALEVGKKQVGVSGAKNKATFRKRLPDGFFVVNKGIKIAIEYESTRKNIHDWADMIRDLEYGLKDREKIDPDTDTIVTGRDFEAVLFVFEQKNTFEVYRNRFVEYSNFRHGGRNHERVVISPHCFFLTTLDCLKNGKVFSGVKEISFTGFLEIVKGLHSDVAVGKMGAVA